MERKVKVVTLYSPSHKKMLDEYFLPSFPKNENLELVIREAPQTAGEKPSFNNSDWTEFMKIKSQLLYDELLNIPQSEYYIFSDCDVICVNDFTNHISEKMQNLDIYCQSDSPLPQYPNYCTGILVLKNTEKVRYLLRAVNEIMRGILKLPINGTFKNEQEVFTFLASNASRFKEIEGLQLETMPFDIAFTYGSLNRGVWHGESPDFDLPNKEKLLWVHANYALHEWKEPLLKLFTEKLKHGS